MSAKKMGRPTDSPKDISLRIRIDAQTDKKLKECSESLKVNKSEVVRKGIDRIHGDLKK